MFRIYYADLAKALKDKSFKVRPVVVVEEDEKNVKVFAITSRNRFGKYYIHMNNYKVYGMCNTSRLYTIPKKYLLNYVRDCTTSETEPIRQRLDSINLKKGIDKHDEVCYNKSTVKEMLK